MRVRETIEARGYFWRGHDIQRSHRVAGTLTVTESGGITLEVFGVRESPSWDHARQSLLWHGQSEPQIVGFVEGHGRVVLHRCSPTAYRTYGAMMSSFASVSYMARSLVTLKDGEVQDDSVVHRLGLDIEGLTRWIGKTGYSLVDTDGEQADKTPTHLGFEWLDDIEFDLGDGIRGSFMFRGMSPDLAVITNPLDMQLKQDVVMGLSREGGWHLEEAIEFVVKCRNLIALLTDEPVEVFGVSSEWVAGVENESLVRSPSGEVYYESMPYHQSGPDEIAIRTVVRYQELDGHLERVLQDWFSLCDRASQALDIYFTFRYSETVPLIEGFLALTRALEAFHRQTTGVLDAPFRRRLDAIMNSYERVFPHEGKRNDFVLAVRDARNYFTHFEPGISECGREECTIVVASMEIGKGVANVHIGQHLASTLVGRPS